MTVSRSERGAFSYLPHSSATREAEDTVARWFAAARDRLSGACIGRADSEGPSPSRDRRRYRVSLQLKSASTLQATKENNHAWPRTITSARKGRGRQFTTDTATSDAFDLPRAEGAPQTLYTDTATSSASDLSSAGGALETLSI